MRIAVLMKQVPRSEELTLVNGRLSRDGVELEVNAYCRRANAKAVELAGPGGEVVVFTMGPPPADEALREMIACGAHRGVHLCDPAFAGSDTLATARALAVAVYREGPFDLVLCGLNSIDADTGQVGPELAELLGLPFVAGARSLDVTPDGSQLTVRCETDDGYETVLVSLPATVSAAERLCDPSKAPPDQRAMVPADRISLLTADDLRLRPSQVGAAGSPTTVGSPRMCTTRREGRIVSSAAEAVEHLLARGALHAGSNQDDAAEVPVYAAGPLDIWCVLGIDDPLRVELLGEAAHHAARVGGHVTAVVPAAPNVPLGPAGADRVLVVPGEHATDWGERLAVLAGAERPRVLLVEGTATGRAVASKIAARHGWGLIGDGIELEVAGDGALTVWKPAFGGQLLAPIRSSSAVQVATIRPGVLPTRRPRRTSDVPTRTIEVETTRSPGVQLLHREVIDGGRAELAGADVVIGVGQGVDPDDYLLLEPLRHQLGAVLGATRKVTDKGWMPRGRQIGITGLSISPRLYLAIGASGRFNHTAGFQAAQHVLAINDTPDAEIFQCADVGVVGDWRGVVADLEAVLTSVLQDSASR